MNETVSIGPAGWSYPDWVGTVYPRRNRTGFDPLEYVSRYFDLVEINSTFYRIPSRQTCARWNDRIPDGRNFTFTLKAHKSLTHMRGDISDSAIAAFTRSTAPLMESGKLRFILLQFPWSFRFTSRSRARIKKLSDGLGSLPIALEVRHGSWAAPEAAAFIRERQLTLCGIDQPQIGDSLGPETFIPGPDGAYFRFHGRNAREWFRPGTNRDLRYDYLYSRDELHPWVRKIRLAAATGSPVMVVLNNHFRGQAAANALELKSLLTGKHVPVPPALLGAMPRLRAIASRSTEAGSVADDVIQGSLFQDQKGQDEDDEKSRQHDPSAADDD